MKRKLIFVLLMSGVILSPLGVHAMIEEGAPGSSVSRAPQSYIKSLEEKIEQGKAEQAKKNPTFCLSFPEFHLSPEEQDDYYDYQMLKKKIEQRKAEQAKKNPTFCQSIPQFYLSPEEVIRYEHYVTKK